MHTAPPPRHRCARRWRLPTPWIAALALVACANAPPPNAQMDAATDAVRRAFDAGAQQFAPVELALARDKLHRATVAIIAKDHDGARVLAEQAEVDARLAQARTESAQARKGR